MNLYLFIEIGKESPIITSVYDIDIMTYDNYYTPRGIRIPVSSVKGKCPWPLDDGGY